MNDKPRFPHVAPTNPVVDRLDRIEEVLIANTKKTENLGSQLYPLKEMLARAEFKLRGTPSESDLLEMLWEMINFVKEK
jgi:hypothetical protein